MGGGGEGGKGGGETEGGRCGEGTRTERDTETERVSVSDTSPDKSTAPPCVSRSNTTHVMVILQQALQDLPQVANLQIHEPPLHS